MRLFATSSIVTLFLAAVAAAQLTVASVERLGPATTAIAPLNFLVSFSELAQGVDITDFSPLTSISGATISGFGNNALDFRFGGGRPTRAYCSGLAGTFNDLTVEFWIATDDAGGTVVDYATSAAADDEITIRDTGADQWVFIVGNTTLVTITANLNDQAWHHVAATWTKATGAAAMYVDGVLAGTGTGMAGHVIPSGGSFIFGSNVTNNPANPASLNFTNNLYGRFDDVRVWNIARTGSQIATARDRALRPSTIGLVLNWQCDLAENCGVGAAGANDVRDIGPNGNHAVFGNATTPQFIAGPPTDGLRYRVTVSIPPQCSGTVGLDVLNDGSITRVSNGAALTNAAYTSEEYTFTGPSLLTLPGTFEDLLLFPVNVDGALSNCVTDSSSIAIHIESPLGGFNYTVPIVIAQFYPAGAWPGSSYPGIQMDVFSALPPVVIFDGNAAAGAFGPTLMGPGGFTIAGYFPNGLQGFSFMLQGLCLSGAAANGIFASTNARELTIY